MDLQTAFDLAKKQLDHGNLIEGYLMDDGRLYPAYYTREEWESFLNYMETNYPIAHHSFDDGNGGELEEKRFKGKLVPPKMASYGSSSRFLFMLAKDIPYFEFECKLPISIPGPRPGTETEASLDGYLPSKQIFVEAKCHEIYKPSKHEHNVKYDAFYDFLMDGTNGRFSWGLDKGVSRRGNPYEHFSYYWDGRRIESYDIKQVLCHLLGIGKKCLTNHCFDKVQLLYLVYKPGDKLLSFIDDCQTRLSILEAWEKEKKEAESIDYDAVYKSILLFLRNHQHIGLDLPEKDVLKMAENFSFSFCDQHSFLSYLQ